MYYAIDCLKMQTPFVLSVGGEEHTVHSVTATKATTLPDGVVDRVSFHIMGNKWINAIEFTGHSFVTVYRTED